MKINIGKERALNHENVRYKADANGDIEVPDDIADDIEKKYKDFITEKRKDKEESKKSKKGREVKHDA